MKERWNKTMICTTIVNLLKSVSIQQYVCHICIIVHDDNPNPSYGMSHQEVFPTVKLVQSTLHHQAVSTLGTYSTVRALVPQALESLTHLWI